MDPASAPRQLLPLQEGLGHIDEVEVVSFRGRDLAGDLGVRGVDGRGGQLAPSSQFDQVGVRVVLCTSSFLF